MKAITKPLRHLLIAAGREFFAPRAARRQVEWPEDESGVSVHMVVGHNMLAMGLLALRSWEFHTRRRWPLIIHDDGSFTDQDRKTLFDHFPQVRIVDRAQADEEVAARLEELPACRRHRMNHHWFLKVFDTRHYAPNHRYLIIDSDIVFFRNPSLVVDWVDRGSDEMWIMEDEREKYSQPRSELESAMGMSVLQKGNSGLDLMSKTAADLTLANKFLERCAATARQYEFLEQTIFTLWASAWGNGGLLPSEQYEISWNNFRGKQAVCRHYIGPAKNDALYVEGATVFWWQSLAA